MQRSPCASPQAHGDVLGLPLYFPKEEEAVLLGAAILAATAGGAYESVAAAMTAMSTIGSELQPSADPRVAVYHAKKYSVFRKLTDDQIAYRAMMAGSPR